MNDNVGLVPRTPIVVRQTKLYEAIFSQCRKQRAGITCSQQCCLIALILLITSRIKRIKWSTERKGIWRGGGEVEPLSVPMRGRGERLKRFRFRVWHLSKGSTCSAIQLTSLFIVIKNVTKFSRKLEFHYFLQVLKMARKSSLISVIWPFHSQGQAANQLLLVLLV